MLFESSQKHCEGYHEVQNDSAASRRRPATRPIATNTQQFILN